MTYEYLCKACHHEWEASQSIKDPPLTKCPQCNKRTAQRLVSGGTGFVLKGGGWYADLYSSSKPKTADATSSDGASADSTNSKTETKEAASKTTESKKAETAGSTTKEKPASSTGSSATATN